MLELDATQSIASFKEFFSGRHCRLRPEWSKLRKHKVEGEDLGEGEASPSHQLGGLRAL